MIIAGSASVVAAMMWLMNDGTMCTKMVRIWLQPDQPRGDDEVLLAQGQEAPAHHARQLGPAEQRDDDGDGEVDLQDRPVPRQRRGQAHPQRDRRDRAEDLDDPLDDACRRRRRRSPRARRGRRPGPGSSSRPTRPIVSEMRVPYIRRDHRSRPCTSVPSRKIVWAASRPPSTPIRWRVVGISPRKLVLEALGEEPDGDLLAGVGAIDALEGLRVAARP